MQGEDPACVLNGMTADAGIMLSRTNLPQLLQVSLQADTDKQHCCAWLRMLFIAMAYAMNDQPRAQVPPAASSLPLATHSDINKHLCTRSQAIYGTLSC
jgi:hypothetical protein